jgi:hypothetical protein
MPIVPVFAQESPAICGVNSEQSQQIQQSLVLE